MDVENEMEDSHLGDEMNIADGAAAAHHINVVNVMGDSRLGDEMSITDGAAAALDMDDTEMEDLHVKPTLNTPADAVAYWNLSLKRGNLSCHHFREWWRRVVPKILSPSPTMDYQAPISHIDDEVVRKQLIQPLEQFICDGNPDDVMEKLSKLNDPPAQCGKLFKMGEPTYSCKDCSHDPTCVLCVDCFKNSEHKNHRYKMSTSCGGGYCDCGDAEAWSDFVHCSTHIKGTQVKEKNRNPLEKMPLIIQERTRHVFLSVMRYAYDILTAESQLNLPADLTYKDRDNLDPMEQMDNEDTYCTVVYNDELHTFDEVISTLPRAVDCDRNAAIGFATLIDREGRAIVKCSGFQICNEAKRITEGITSRRGSKPLKVVIMHSHLVAHQNFALKLLTWMQNTLNFSSGFRSLFCSIVLERDDLVARQQSIVEAICCHDTMLWKSARTLMHHLLISGMLMENEAKKRFACEFTKHFGTMMKDFIHDDHEHSFSITSLSVQLFTVPSLAHHLIANEFVLPILLRTFMSEIERKRNDAGKIEFNKNFNSNSYKRCFYTMYDLKYLLTTCPSPGLEWDDKLRKGFLHGASLFFDILTWMQGMDQQTRQTTHHVEYELEWENAFNMHIKMAPACNLINVWCGTDRVVFIKSIRMILKKLYDDIKNEEGETNFKEQTVLGKTAECISYQVSTKPISIHAPLSRMLAGLSLHMGKFDLEFDSSEFSISEKPKMVQLMEPSLRTIVLIAQVQAGMWRRNGYSLVDQVRVYHGPRCRREMYDEDVIMLQLACANMDPDTFLINLLNKFHLISWSSSDFDCSEDDSIRQVVTLVEEFLSTMIIILGERSTPGIGQVTPEEALKKEIIQLLCVEPMSHSALNKALSEDVVNRETGMEKVIESVATFKKPSSGTGKGIYELKEEFYEDYNVFFYHYSKEEQSRSEEAQRNRQKAKNLPQCNPPPPSPPFTSQFQRITQVMDCDVFIHMLKIILQRADDLKARCFSESQVHKVLHLIGISLHEQARLDKESKKSANNSRHFKFLSKCQAVGMLECLESLVGNQRIASHKELLLWTIRKFKEVSGEKQLEEEPLNSSGANEAAVQEEEDMDWETKKRKAAAAERRAKVMAQMRSAQNTFMKENATLFEEIPSNKSFNDQSNASLEDMFEILSCTPECLGASKTSPVQEDTDFTCILCQEDVVLSAEGQCLVMAAFVQNSTVLSRRTFTPDTEPSAMFETPPQYSSCPILLADMPFSPYTSSCGHVMHSNCWQKYYDDILKHERQRNSRLRHPHSFDVEKQEFLCPLCRCLSNTVVPIIPQFHVLQPPRMEIGDKEDNIEQANIKFYDWIQALMISLKYKRELTDKESEEKSDDKSSAAAVVAETTATKKRFYTCPLDQVVQELQQLNLNSVAYARLYTDHEGSELQFSESIFEMMNLFSQAVFRYSLNSAPDIQDERIPLMVWQTCAYTIHSIIFSMLDQGKHIFGSMSSRQRDCLSTLVRFCGVVGTNFGEPKVIRSHSLKLLSTLLEVDTANLCVLEFDAFGILVALTFSLPSLFNVTQAAPLPSCNVQDQHVFHLIFVLHMVQILLTTDQFSSDDEQEFEFVDDAVDEEEKEAQPVLDLLQIVREAVGFATEGDGMDGLKATNVWSDLKEASLPFLRSCALFYHHLSSVPFPDKLKDAYLDNEFDSLMGYLGMPTSPEKLFRSPQLALLAKRWANHPNVHIMLSPASKSTPVTHPMKIKPLVTLPQDYSELINTLSSFTCPRFIADDSRVPAMCLKCGHIMCSQSYCCQTILGSEQVGACTAHAHYCGAGNGIFLRVRECKVVLLSGRSKGCFISPPYLDQYGETDVGLRRGNPLTLCQEKLQKIQKLWFNHQIPEDISHALESNLMLVATPWHHL